MAREGFARVQRQERPPTREMQHRAGLDQVRDLGQGQSGFGPGLSTGGQVQALGGGKFGVSAAAGSVGETSPNFHDDPTINAIVKMPSLEEAKTYTGADPSFFGVQRPGDWQRKVQGDMAADALPGGKRQLASLQDGAREKATRRSMMQPGYGLT